MKRFFIMMAFAAIATAMFAGSFSPVREFRKTDMGELCRHQFHAGYASREMVRHYASGNYSLKANNTVSRADALSMTFSIADPEKYSIILAVGINSLTGDIAYVADADNWNDPVYLSPGNYKFFFWAGGEDEPYDNYVYGDENASLTESGTYVVDFSKCTEYVDFRALLPDGTPAKESLTNMDSGQVVEEGSLDSGFWTLYFFLDNTLLDFQSGLMSRGVFDDGWSYDDEKMGNVFVNPGLESISIVQYRQMIGSENNKGIYYAAMKASPARGGVYSNTPSDYNHISNPFHATVEGSVCDKTSPALYTTVVLGDTPIFNRVISNGGGIWPQSDDYWFTDNNITAEHELSFYFCPAEISATGYEFSSGSDSSLGIISNPVEAYDGQISCLATVSAMNSLSSLDLYNNFRYESNGKPSWLFNPYFTFSDDHKMIEDGNSVPVLVTEQLWYTGEIAEADGLRNAFYHSYKGRNGEVRTADLKVETVKVSIGGEEQDLSDFPTLSRFVGAKSRERQGIWDIEIKDNNCLVGDTKGYNHTKIHFNDKGDDVTAPTLQMLMTLDSDKNITDRFDSPADGNLRIAGGDFTPHYNQAANIEWFSVEECDIKVEYSVLGEDNWVELECMENRNGFMEPGWGALWEVSLSSIKAETTETRYDLRITLTDDAGNSQQQTLSPVFSIAAASGIDTVEMETLSMDSEYYNLQGIRILEPANGKIYIERRSDGSVRKIMMK